VAKIIAGLSEIASAFDAVILDLWGCLHDGVRAYPAALACLAALKDAGKDVAIMSNAPRRAKDVAARLAPLGIAPTHYRHLFSSGEETWLALKEGNAFGPRCYPVMPARDLGLLEGLPLESAAHPAAADFLLVTGAEGPEQVEDFAPLLQEALAADLPLVCANPDLLVHRGGVAEICAGAIAQRYETMGGAVIYYGKPYPGIYRHAFAAMKVAAPHRVLAIGDSFRTDIKGAAQSGAQSLLVAGGIHHAEILVQEKIDAARLAEAEAEHEDVPNFAIAYLAW